MENFETKDMKISEYKVDIDQWNKQMEAKKEQETKKSEDDWDCQNCNTVNKMDMRDIYSAFCKKCK